MSRGFLSVLAEPNATSFLKFLELAYGLVDDRALPRVAAETLPDPLLRLWRRLGADPALYHQNRLLVPDGMSLEHGRLIFYEECVGAWQCATSSDGSRALVWSRYPYRDAEWRLEPVDLDLFLLETLLIEFATYGAPTWAWCPEPLRGEDIERAMSHLVPVPLPRMLVREYEPGGIRFFATDNVVVQVINGSVWAGAMSHDGFNAISSLMSDSWEIE